MRIIAGEARGRRLFPPDNGAIRPTSDRVRENLFNLLMGRVENARVLDLFCGSGAVGIEALSRGAQHVVFIDSAPAALTLTRRNLEHCQLTSRAELRQIALPEGLRRANAPFDIIFADPPYAFDAHTPLLEALAKGAFISPQTRIVIESPRNATLPDHVHHLELIRTRTYGDTSLNFFAPADNQTPE